MVKKDFSKDGMRFLIARLSAIGDCILTVPLLCALRDAYPDAFIAWLVETTAAPLLENHPALDRLIVVPRRWLKSPRTVSRLRRQLKEHRFDVTLDPQGLSKSAIPAWLSGAKHRIGLKGEWGNELSPWLNNIRVLPKQVHVVDRSLEILSPLGIERPAVRFELAVDQDASEWADTYLRQLDVDRGFVAINPGAGWDSRLWPAERFGEVARHIRDRTGKLPVVTWAGEREEKWADDIVASSAGHAIKALPTSLTQLRELLRRASLFVGNDTGPMHLAAAVGTRCISLHGTTRAEQSGPYGDAHRVIQQQFRSGSRRQRRRLDNQAMRLIQVEEVCRACDELLQRQPVRSGTAA